MPGISSIRHAAEGDANNDNVVNISDFALLAAAFGREFWHPEFDARADLTTTISSTLRGLFRCWRRISGQVGAP
ncbi:MAG: hypothetical protein IPK19_24280 [Chloroflexi bacterium]|nr:hypothetical protein [Chloroflexota bacterium]